MIIFLPKVLHYSVGYLLVEQPCRLQTNRAYLATCVLTFCRNKKAIESGMNIIYPKQMQIPIKEPGYKYYFVLETYPMYCFRYIVSKNCFLFLSLSLRSAPTLISFFTFFTFTFWHSFIYVASPWPLFTLMID